MAYIGKIPTAAALTSSDISDGIITNAKLAQDIISGDTALGATPADTDEFLVSDAGTLKRIDYSLIKGGGKILQVVTANDETLRETTSTTYASLTLTAAITPSATSSKILILCGLMSSTAFNNKKAYFTIYRDSSDIGNTDGSGIFYNNDSADWDVSGSEIIHLVDSPSSTSEIDYTLYGKCDSSGKARINPGSFGRSTITLMEIGA